MPDLALAPEPAPAVLPAPPYDAVLCSRYYPAGKVEDARHLALREEFAPVLGDKRIYARLCGDRTFITPFAQGPQRCHRYWPKTSGKEGQEFYDWHDRGDGILYGVLTEEAKAYVAAERV